MNIPTSSFINLPSNFLSNLFALVGYLTSNFYDILAIGLAISILVLILSIIFNFIK